jgi:hypothetical protein
MAHSRAARPAYQALTMAWAEILFLLLGFAHLNRKDNQTYCSGNMKKHFNLHSEQKYHC